MWCVKIDCVVWVVLCVDIGVIVVVIRWFFVKLFSVVNVFGDYVRFVFVWCGCGCLND